MTDSNGKTKICFLFYLEKVMYWQANFLFHFLWSLSRYTIAICKSKAFLRAATSTTLIFEPQWQQADTSHGACFSVSARFCTSIHWKWKGRYIMQLYERMLVPGCFLNEKKILSEQYQAVNFSPRIWARTEPFSVIPNPTRTYKNYGSTPCRIP